MAPSQPPKDHFWTQLVIVLVAAAVIWGGVSLISSAPMGANDWFGIGPIFIVPGLLCLLIGGAVIVAIVSLRDRG